MLTEDDVATGTWFHLTPTPWGSGRPCEAQRGPMRWHRNGVTKMSSDGSYKVPVKHGLYVYDYITPESEPYMHTEASCPAVTK